MTLEARSGPREFWLTRDLIIDPLVDSFFQPPAAPFHIIPRLLWPTEMYAVAERALFLIKCILETFCISNACIVASFERFDFGFTIKTMVVPFR